jgi:hypothetical protein
MSQLEAGQAGASREMTLLKRELTTEVSRIAELERSVDAAKFGEREAKEELAAVRKLMAEEKKVLEDLQVGCSWPAHSLPVARSCVSGLVRPLDVALV